MGGQGTHLLVLQRQRHVQHAHPHRLHECLLQMQQRLGFHLPRLRALLCASGLRLAAVLVTPTLHHPASGWKRAPGGSPRRRRGRDPLFLC
ncbi:hypothetical protein NDU88_000701 [Pleurodeles waltl]|uniref:Uncharacterized protein n=1 Tax=Pleurodeles waltl TaxID=8319 RepID=A0AAV7Q115_PLEWA|nr:hypothetical protein NDU88_000701 [Pleurodeles waltl]